MSDDRFFESLRNDWREQDADIAALRADLKRRRWLPHAVLAGESLGGLVVVATGLWFAVQAWVQKDLLLALSAAAALGVMPAVVIALWRARWPALAWQEETPEGVVALALTRLQSTARAVRLGRWSVWTLLALVALLWAAVAVRLTPLTPFLAFVTAVWLAAALMAWLWLSWRAGRLAAEIARCEALRRELEG